MAHELDRIHRGTSDSAPIPIQPAAAHKAFRRALNSLPPEGGVQLHVSAGSAPYELAKEVLVDRPDVELRFSRGSELRFAPGSTQRDLFRATARGFAVYGARVTHVAEASGSPPQRSIFRVEDASLSDPSDDARFVDCHFDLSQEDAGLVGFSCIRAQGLDPTRPRRGLDVRATTFEYSKVGVKQAVSWQDGQPCGITAVRAENSREVLITRSAFRGVLTQISPDGLLAASRCGPMVLLQSTSDCVVSANTFNLLDLIPLAGASQAASLVHVQGGRGAEGHHTVLVGNVVEAVGTRHAIELSGLAADVVADSNFGRVFQTTAVIGTTPGSALERGQALVVSANNFHNVQPELQIRLEAVADVTIDNNAFNLVQLDHKPLEIVPGSCANVHVGANQARTRPVG